MGASIRIRSVVGIVWLWTEDLECPEEQHPGQWRLALNLK